MFRRRARADRAFREAQHASQAMLAMPAQQPWPTDPGLVAAAVPATPDTAVELDFLPPDFRAPSRKDVEGFMMRWDSPLVIDGEVRQCPACGAYRNWIIFNLRDDSVWLRCRAGHETKETGLDTAWYNRNSGPADRWHPTLEDGLRHLGH
ncbi:hypothetical protein [Streptomyces sp. SID3915]|uniref:hypothetical protein n=1 Tax=unclassified Streptomyces TaxID=2593676 RepID=UPI00137083FF|nr:hypothetical protein [Streptomyces sp. SID3915]MYX71335.1 hypothetical protein [Streptomyces sp. SID3915]